ncbi:hypothetical protein D9M70_569200 [compost metagenome]
MEQQVPEFVSQGEALAVARPVGRDDDDWLAGHAGLQAVELRLHIHLGNDHQDAVGLQDINEVGNGVEAQLPGGP